MNRKINYIENTFYKRIILTGLLFSAILFFSYAQNVQYNAIVISDYKKADSVQYSIDSAFIVDSVLILNVGYYGGENDSFDLLFSGNFKKSYPPIVHLYLNHIKLNPGIFEYQKKQLKFILSKIEYPHNKTTIVYLWNYDKVLIYKYNH